MADVRIHDLPSAASWNGFFPQDKPGGPTECVSVATVEAKLVSDGFVKTAVLVAGYQPLENQRLRTTDNVNFNKLQIAGVDRITNAGGFVGTSLQISGATANKLARFDASKNLVSYDLVAADIPALDAAKITTGTWADARIASAPTWNAKLAPSNVSGYANEVAAFVGVNTVNGDSGLKRYQTGGITTKLGLGTSEVVNAFFAVQCQVGGTSAYRHYQGLALRFQEVLRTDGSWALQAHDAYDALIDAPITVGNGSGGTIALGGGGRPVNLTGGSKLQINGTDAITSARAGSLTALTVGSTTGFVRSASGVYSASALVAADIPSLDTAKITTGTFADARIASAATWNAKLSPSAVSGVTGNIAIFSGANSVSDNTGLFFDGTGLWCDGYIHGGGFKVSGSNFVDASRNIVNGGSGTFSGALWGYGLRSTGNVTIDTGYALVIDSVTRIGATGIGNLLKLQIAGVDRITNVGGFVGTSLQISGATANKLARFDASKNLVSYDLTLTIGATGKTIDGTGNQSWSLAEIGAQAAGSYQPLPISKTVLVKRGTGNQTLYTRNFSANEMNVLGKTIKVIFYATALNPAQGDFEVMFGNMSLGHCGIIPGVIAKFEFVFSVETIGTGGKFCTAMVNSTNNGSVGSGSDWGPGVNLTIAQTFSVNFSQTIAGTVIINQMSVEIIEP